MSTEAAATARFLDRLRATAPRAVVTKYNDHMTSGLPDASVTHRGRTVWLEFKVWTADGAGSLKSLLKRTNRHAALQLHMLWRYHVASEGRAFLALFEGRLMSLYQVLDSRGHELRQAARGTPDDIIDQLLSLTS